MTTNRFKDFGSGEGVETSPLSFKLHNEEFHCVPAVQGKLMLQLAASSGDNDPSKAAGMIDTFFEQVLLEESYTRFSALLASEKIVPVETLANITAWLVEEYSGRPTERPEVS
jgi:hypothetical protein